MYTYSNCKCLRICDRFCNGRECTSAFVKSWKDVVMRAYKRYEPDFNS